MIYLDNNATTCIDPHILDRYTSLLRGGLGNSHSMHAMGRQSRQIMQKAKQRIADCFGIDGKGVILTSGATESIYTLVFSISGHIVSSVLEHSAVREALQSREKPVTILSPEAGKGSIALQQIMAACRPDTEAIVLNAANHETGICNPILEIAEWAQIHDILLIVDAVGLVGKKKWQQLPGRVALILSGHKIHAPVGIGAILLQGKVPYRPLFLGGQQQRGMRGGTEMVALADSLAGALEALHPDDFDRMQRLRDDFEQQIATLLQVVIHGQKEDRVSSVSNIAFLSIDGETLLMQLDLQGIAASHGSACQTGAFQLSPVLLGMGLGRDEVRRSLRFSLSRWTTKEELHTVVAQLRSIIPHGPKQSS